MAELTMLETLLDGISPSTERKLYDIFTSPQDDDPVSPLKHMFQNLSKCKLPDANGVLKPLMPELMMDTFGTAGGLKGLF